MSNVEVIGNKDPDYIAANWKKVIGEWQKSERLVPITGAGIGTNFKLPNWEKLTDLLCDVLGNLNDQQEYSIRRERDLMLKAFRATHRITHNMRHRTGIKEILRSTLYSAYTITTEGVWWLECIYQLASSSGMHITLNFDDLLELYSTAIHPDKIVSPVLLNRVESKRQGQIDSYHVHGILPRSASSKYESETIVFDLLSYVEKYEHYIDQMSVTLLHAFTNNRCIFLGLSMVDPNLLRLIKTGHDLRNDRSCWGMVFGDIAPEIADILSEWGLACIDMPLGSPPNYSIIPANILQNLPLTDQPDISGQRNRFEKLTM